MERPDAAADVIAREDGGEAEGRLHQLHRQLEKVLLAQEHLRQGRGVAVAARAGARAERHGRACRSGRGMPSRRSASGLSEIVTNSMSSSSTRRAAR